MMRAPMADGGGSSTKGMPAPRVTASQITSTQRPNSAGTMNCAAKPLPARTLSLPESTETSRQASSQFAARSAKKPRPALPSAPVTMPSNSSAATWQAIAWSHSGQPLAGITSEAAKAMSVSANASSVADVLAEVVSGSPVSASTVAAAAAIACQLGFIRVMQASRPCGP